MNIIRTSVYTALFFLAVSPYALAGPGPSFQGNTEGNCPWQKTSQRQGIFSDIRRSSREKIETFRKEQEQKRKEFFRSLEGLEPQARQDAVLRHMEEQKQARDRFRQDLHAENLTKLTEQLNQDPNLSEEEKQRILTEFRSRYEKRAEQQDARYAQRRDRFLSIISDESLSAEQKQSLLSEARRQDRGERQQKHHGPSSQKGQGRTF
mgnify:CR=1 FL=1